MAEPIEMKLLSAEDNLSHAELARHTFKRNKIVNRLLHLQDGAETLDFVVSRGIYAGQSLVPGVRQPGSYGLVVNQEPAAVAFLAF